MSKPVIDTKRLAHIVIIVDDIYKSAAKWAELVGRDISELNIRERGNSEGDPLADPRNRWRDDYNYGKGEEYVWIEADIPMDGFIIELIQPEKGKGPFREYYEKYGTGMFDIAFYVDGCDELNEQLDKDGYEYIVDTYHGDDRWPVHNTKEILGTNLCIKPILPGR